MPRPPTPPCCSPTRAGPSPIVGVGLRGSIDELLDGSRDGLGSGYVARLKAGPRLVDATAVPMLYSGQLRARHAYLVLLIGLVAVAAAWPPPTSATSGRSTWASSSSSCRRPARAGLVIRSRSYTVPLVAVLLALATGVALGRRAAR